MSVSSSNRGEMRRILARTYLNILSFLLCLVYYCMHELTQYLLATVIILVSASTTDGFLLYHRHSNHHLDLQHQPTTPSMILSHPWSLAYCSSDKNEVNFAKQVVRRPSCPSCLVCRRYPFEERGAISLIQLLQWSSSMGFPKVDYGLILSWRPCKINTTMQQYI